jgi:hypothetical protein
MARGSNRLGSRSDTVEAACSDVIGDVFDSRPLVAVARWRDGIVWAVRKAEPRPGKHADDKNGGSERFHCASSVRKHSPFSPIRNCRGSQGLRAFRERNCGTEEQTAKLPPTSISG